MGRLNYNQAPALGVPTATPTDVSNQAASTAFVQNLVPPGVVFPYAGPTPPTGWLLCDGSAVSRTTYARLFAAIGTVYGVGDGSTTFNLPDLRGEFLRALDNGRGVDTGRTLGSAQTDALQLIPPGSAGNLLRKQGAQPPSGSFASQGIATTFQAQPGSTGYIFQEEGITFLIPSSVRTDSETRARNVAMNFIIKVQ